MSKELQIIKTTINIGIEKPFKLLHVTDTHLTGNHSRRGCFDNDYSGCIEDYFIKALDYAKKNNMPILHTGDLIDFLSDEIFDFVDKHFSDVDYIYAAGNHDFCHCVGKATEDYAYKWEMIKQIAPHIKSNLYFDSRLINGVNIVTLDDSYYLISDGQTELLKAEAAKGYPIILAMHVPLFTKEFAKKMMLDIGNPCAYLTGAAEEWLSKYPENRRLQQTPDAATLRAIDYIKSEPLIKALIVGHTHVNFEDMLTETLPQYTTHGSFAGYVREIEIV